MKKSTISLSLLLLVGANCLTSCNKSAVKPAKNDKGESVLFEINGESFTANDLLNGKDSKFNLFDSEEGSKLLYTEIEKALIKETVEESEDIKNAVDIKMEEWKEQVKTFAQENSLTERLAEQSMLTEKGFETRDELRESYVFAEQKDQYIKNYQTEHMQPKVENGDIKDFANDKSLLKEYVEKTNPMVMKHILVKVESKDNVFNQAEITETESDKLGTVVKRLALGNKDMNKFTDVAMALSEDEGSGSKGGNLGIVDEYTAFVDEFKYGVYSSLAYNALHDINQEDNTEKGIKHAEFEDICDALDLEKDMFKTGIYKEIGEIEVKDAYDAFINKKEDTVQDEDKKEDFNKYPRNVEFNKEFNSKTASYLKVTDKKATLEMLLNKTLSDEEFAKEEKNLKLDSNGYVIDENGNPIVVVRSEFGIHFISVTYNCFAHEFKDNVKFFMTDTSIDSNVLDNSYYYNKFFDIGHKAESQTTTRKNRKNEIEDRVINYLQGGFGSSITASQELLGYRIFADAMTDKVIVIPNEGIGESVNKTVKKYIELKLAANELKINNAHKQAIEDYVNKIEADQQAYNDLYTKKGAN